MKWHQNNPYRSNINDPIAQIANAGARNWFLDLTAGSGGLPPNREDLAALPVPPPLATDALPNLPENGGYQIICKPVDKQFKIGLREEWEEGWQGGCPDDMDKCQIQEPVAAYPFNTNAGLDRNNWIPCRVCDQYSNGAHPEMPDMCIKAYNRARKFPQLYPEGYAEMAETMTMLDEWPSIGEAIADTGAGVGASIYDEPKVTFECTPRNPGYDPLQGEGFENFGCDHPSWPCTDKMNDALDAAAEAISALALAAEALEAAGTVAPAAVSGDIFQGT